MLGYSHFREPQGPFLGLCVCFSPYESAQIHFFTDVPDLMIQTWIFIPSQSVSTVILARLWNQMEKFLGKETRSLLQVLWGILLIFFFTEARLSDAETKGQKRRLSEEI